MGSYDGVSDEELIRRYRAGESGISDYLIEKYKGMIRTRARAMYLIGGDTDDLIQEGMIGMFKAIRDYQPDREASFFTFATMCVERQLISAIKNYNRQKNMVLNQAVPLEPIEVAEGFFRCCGITWQEKAIPVLASASANRPKRSTTHCSGYAKKSVWRGSREVATGTEKWRLV